MVDHPPTHPLPCPKLPMTRMLTSDLFVVANFVIALPRQLRHQPLFVRLLAGLRKNYSTDVYRIWWATEETISRCW